MEDKTFYQDKEAFRKALVEYFGEKEGAKLYEHEMAHYDVAEKFGLNPRFAIVHERREVQMRGIKASVTLHGACVDHDTPKSLEDQISIALAPKDPSAHDLALVEKLREKLR